MLISRKRWKPAPNVWNDFVDFNICQRMIPLRNLHLMIWTYFFEVNISETWELAQTYEVTKYTNWRLHSISWAECKRCRSPFFDFVSVIYQHFQHNEIDRMKNVHKWDTQSNSCKPQEQISLVTLVQKS